MESDKRRVSWGCVMGLIHLTWGIRSPAMTRDYGPSNGRWYSGPSPLDQVVRSSGQSPWVSFVLRVVWPNVPSLWGAALVLRAAWFNVLSLWGLWSNGPRFWGLPLLSGGIA